MLFSKFVFPNKFASRQSAFPRAGEEARARREAGTAPTLSISLAKPQDRALSARLQQEQGALLRTASGEGQEKGGETAGASRDASQVEGITCCHTNTPSSCSFPPLPLLSQDDITTFTPNNQYASVLFSRNYLIALA